MSDDPVDLDALVAELRERVEARRRSGEYPPGLEDDLGRHVRIILGHRRDERPPPDLRSALERASAALPGGPVRPRTDSKVPGGAAVHATVNRVVSRHSQAVSQQLAGFGDPVLAALSALVEAVEQLTREVRVEVASHLEAIYERQAAQERAMTRAGLDAKPADPGPPSAG